MKKVRFIIFLVIMTAGLMISLSGNAQKDGFFRSNDELAGYRCNESSLFTNRANIADGDFSNETFGEVPLGGGVLIMLSAGIGYALIKRRNSLKTK